MSNQDIQKRVETLEKQLSFLTARYVASLKSDGLRIAELEIKVQHLEARLKDVDTLEDIVFRATIDTDPKIQDDILAIDCVLDMNVARLYFDHLPSIKEHRLKS